MGHFYFFKNDQRRRRELTNRVPSRNLDIAFQTCGDFDPSGDSTGPSKAPRGKALPPDGSPNFRGFTINVGGLGSQMHDANFANLQLYLTTARSRLDRGQIL